MRNTRTPSPYDMGPCSHSIGQQLTRMSPYHQSDAENEEVEVSRRRTPTY